MPRPWWQHPAQLPTSAQRAFDTSLLCGHRPCKVLGAVGSCILRCSYRSTRPPQSASQPCNPPSRQVLHLCLPTVMSQLLCSSQSSGVQRAPTRSQLKVGLPSRLLTALCARHIHCEKAAPLLTSGGSRLQNRGDSSTCAQRARLCWSVCGAACMHACLRLTRCGVTP